MRFMIKPEWNQPTQGTYDRMRNFLLMFRRT